MTPSPQGFARIHFLGRCAVRPVANDGHHRKSQHGERDMPVPSVPGARLVMVEAEFILGGLEAVLDGPAMPFHPHQRFDRRSGRAPCREEGQIAIGDFAPDQQAARPGANVHRERQALTWPGAIGVIVGTVEVGQSPLLNFRLAQPAKNVSRPTHVQ
jgi:hypothetical protein